MEFSTNSIVLYILAVIVVIFVTIMCVVFMVNAYKEGQKRGMSKEKLKKIISSSAIFTIAPSIAILLTVLTLAGNMGLPFPWLRLSVVGAISYEVPAAQNAATAILGENATIAAAASTKEGFSIIAYAMTIGIICGIPFVPFAVKKVQSGLTTIKQKDEKWSKIFSDALFLGLISSFIGVAISGVTTDRSTNASIPATTGSMLVSILTFLTSMFMMLIIGVLVKKLKWKWLEAYAIPICMLSAMGLAIVYKAVLPAGLFV